MNNKDHLQLARDLIIKRDLEWTQAHRESGSQAERRYSLRGIPANSG